MRKANQNNPPNNDNSSNQYQRFQRKYNKTNNKDDAYISSSKKNHSQANWRNSRHDKFIYNQNQQNEDHFNFKQKNPAHGNYRNNNKNDNVHQINISGKFNINLLTDLSNLDSDVIIPKLVKEKVEFQKFLWDIPLELIPVTLKVLANICNANFTEFITTILIPACSNKLLGKLEMYLLKLAYEKEIDKIKNKFYYDNVNRFWSDLTIFFRKAIELLPTKAYVELRSILEKLNMIFDTIDRFQNSYKIDKEIRESALNLFEQLETERKRNEEKNKAFAKPTIPIELEDDNPPNNFRNLCIIPTLDDLIDNKPFIRKCKITESYNSVDHYLDVQFRLLREDFICPLRNGINQYLDVKSQKNRNNDLRVYREVTLLIPEVNKNTVGITVSFRKLQGINWKQSKRLMFGSLLLLSKDNFNNILFMTVANRDENALARGRILVEPCEGTVITQEMYNSKFVMLESKVYFEPYWAVLNAMIHMKESNFPMKDYLISASSIIRLPQYLPQEALLIYKDLKLPVAYDQSWPDAKKLQLDETQLNAFRCALTQEFSLIQGPPGTGKTFIALEIVRTLLTNDKYWKKYGPIVVVCLTNHALDQFLEGILKYTKSIVRIGHRSKNEALKPYTLLERKKCTKCSRGTAASCAFQETKSEYEQILKAIDEIHLDIQYLTTPKAIVPVNLLKQYNDDFILNELKSNEELINWLIEMNISLNFTAPSKYDEPQKNASEALAKDSNHQVENVTIFDERYHEKYMDNELEIDYLFKVDRSYELFYPIEAINYFMLDVKQKLHEYTKEMITEGYSPVFQLPMEFQKHLDILKKNKLFLQKEFARHPLLNRNSTPSENPDWEIYWNWVECSYECAIKRLAELEDEYHKVRLQFNEAKQLVDLAVIKEYKVVGLTTTGAAKLFSTLRALHAPIVLVEEAAEILESHVVCSLTKHCQQVILIGDHKQLQPKTSVYKLGKDYNLNISLFERMVRIRGDCAQLAYQHRMRPLFARLLTPSIYQKLYNHKSVFEYPLIKGLTKSLFFLNHSHREETYDNEDSWVNKHEIELLIGFARHLILQGYGTSEITVLCTYTGQLFALTKERDRHSSILQGLRVTTVDNFQGEENKIILLSLVRNNGEGNIGFLKEENRVCVALSRAREGLYIMGNMDDLVVKNSIWPKIKSVLEKNQAIGDALQLRCQIHSEQFIQIKHVDDFQKCVEGGCSKMCGLDMPCGHPCLSICHLRDREHKEFACRQPCLKACPFNHPCPLICCEGCKPCEVKVERKLSNCGHTVEMFCSSDPKTFQCSIQEETTLPDCNHQIKKLCSSDVKLVQCTHPCDSRLPCGHTCRRKCHVNSDPDHIEYKCKKDCAKTYTGCENNHQCKKQCFEECGLCPIKVEKIRSCGHFYKQAQCGEDLEKQPCIRPCKRDIPSCGHKCKQKCSDPCGNCQIIVKKISASCNHEIKVKCCEEATFSKCTGKCPNILPCGHPCTEKCKDRCTTVCQVMVNRDQPGLCGHIFKVPCFLQTSDNKSEALMRYCKKPCGTELECKHFCNGNCGDCMQGRIHALCSNTCGFPLVCGHECNEPCREACKPCKKKCEIQCFHSKCKQKCGIPCVPCKEPCILGCEHKKCTKRCSELCDIEPCTEPCKRYLKCGHFCVGFCGDPCPPLCRICDKEELTTVKLCREDEPDARFVVLENCGHCIESNDLADWLKVDDELIQVKRCPLDYCKKPIHNCARLTNKIKTNWSKVLRVKEKVFCGTYKDLRHTQLNHLQTIKELIVDPICRVYPEIRSFLEDLNKRTTLMKPNKRKQILSAQENDACRAILDVVRAMNDILSLTKVSGITKSVKSYANVILQVSMILNAIPSTWHFPKQRMNDIQFELLRLEYMIKVYNLEYKNENRIPLEQPKGFQDVMAMLVRCQRFDEKLQSEVLEKINSLQIETTKRVEMRVIVEAMNLKSGHWYECPNGHPYAIGDCGRAMQVAKCFCGAPIGGSQHTLLRSNRASTKMNGASAL